MTGAQSVIVDAINNSPKENRLKITVEALNDYYSDKAPTLSESRHMKIVGLCTGYTDKNIIRYFIESNLPQQFSTTIESFNTFLLGLSSHDPIEGINVSVQCITPFGIYEGDKIYDGRWVQSKTCGLRVDFNQSLPHITSHPTVTYDIGSKQINTQKQFKLL